MAKPVANYRILPNNNSSFNIIAHEKYVPPSPPFGPTQRSLHMDPRIDYKAPCAYGRSDYENNRLEHRRQEWNNTNENESQRRQEPNYSVDNEHRITKDTIQHANHIPASPLYRPGQGQGYRGYNGDRTEEDRNYQGSPRRTDGFKASHNFRHEKGFNSLGKTIGKVDHVPVSPLYYPGLGQGLSMADPRYGTPQRHRLGVQEVPRPKEPPTPDYNTTGLQIPDNSHVENMNLQLGGLKDGQEDYKDNRTNNASWAGYLDRPTNREPPYTDRPGNRDEKSYRDNPWSSRERALRFVVDPRVGGHHDGIGLGRSRNGGALLFIRFPVGQDENVHSAAHAFLRSKTQDTGGRFLGIAKRVFDFGYEKGPTEGIGVFHFPSIEKANMFFQTDPILRQPDFPAPNGHAEIWIINNAYLPDNLQLFSTFLLSEIELHSGKDKREFFETFQKPFESYLYKNGAMPFTVCSYGELDRKSVRRHMYPPTAIVTCHLFQGLDHLNWITNDETYSKFRSLHNQMATEKCSIFTLSQDMFP